MNLSISNIAWDNEFDNEVYNQMQNLKFNGLEIAPTRFFPKNPYSRKQEAKDLTMYLKLKYGLSICSMQSIWYGKNEKIFLLKEEREELLRYTKQAIDFAEAIQCGNLVFGCPKNRVIENDEQMEIAYDFFYKLGEYAKAHNTILAIEPNPTIYQTNFITRTKEAFDFVKQVGSLGIMVNLDMGTMIQNSENLHELDGNLHYVNHIHISEPYLEIIKERALYYDLAKILKNSNYNKFISIEMKKAENIENVYSVMRMIKEIFA